VAYVGTGASSTDVVTAGGPEYVVVTAGGPEYVVVTGSPTAVVTLDWAEVVLLYAS
jgi:hypothetical protein